MVLSYKDFTAGKNTLGRSVAAAAFRRIRKSRHAWRCYKRPRLVTVIGCRQLPGSLFILTYHRTTGVWVLEFPHKEKDRNVTYFIQLPKKYTDEKI